MSVDGLRIHIRREPDVTRAILEVGRLCKELGFATATTTVAGVLRPEHRDSLHSLPRLPIWTNEARATIAPKLSGAFEMMLRLRGSKAA